MKDTHSFLLFLFRVTGLPQTPLDTKQILSLHYFSVKQLEISFLNIQLFSCQGGLRNTWNTSETPAICSVLNSNLQRSRTGQIPHLSSLPPASSSIMYVSTNLNEIWTNVVGSGLEPQCSSSAPTKARQELVGAPARTKGRSVVHLPPPL